MKFNLVILTLLYISGWTSILHTQVSLASPLTFEKTAEIQEIYQGTLELKNNGKEENGVRIYKRDYIFFADGSVIYGEPGLLSRSNANWITVSPSQLQIPSMETAFIHFSVQVPDVENLVGTYWSVIMIENLPKTDPNTTSTERKEGHVGLQQILRYAIQIVTHIGDTGKRELKIINAKLEKTEDKKHLKIDIENTGERALRALFSAEIYDSKGNHLTTITGDRKRTYPGTSVNFTADLTELSHGEYNILVILDCGGDDVFGASLTLLIKDE